MPGRDIVVAGFSAGGMDPLMQLVADLPRDLPASVFVARPPPAQSADALVRGVARSYSGLGADRT